MTIADEDKGSMKIMWAATLATGVAWVDEQHKELFERVNLLMDAIEEGSGTAKVERTVSFLDQYVVEHFADEESAMDLHDYPERDSHKVQHAKFKVSIKTLLSDLESRNVEILPSRLKGSLVDWITVHVCDLDMRFADFVRARTSLDPA